VIVALYPCLVGFGASFAFFYTLALGPPSAVLSMIWWEVVIVLRVTGGTWCLVGGMYRWWAKLIDGRSYSAVVMSQVVVWPVLIVDDQSWQSWRCLLPRRRERGWPGVK